MASPYYPTLDILAVTTSTLYILNGYALLYGTTYYPGIRAGKAEQPVRAAKEPNPIYTRGAERQEEEERSMGMG